jgi:hypothetical protein
LLVSGVGEMLAACTVAITAPSNGFSHNRNANPLTANGTVSTTVVQVVYRVNGTVEATHIVVANQGAWTDTHSFASSGGAYIDAQGMTGSDKNNPGVPAGCVSYVGGSIF